MKHTDENLPIDTRRALYRAKLDRAAAALNARIARRPLVVRHRNDGADDPTLHYRLGRIVRAFRRGVFLYYEFDNGAVALINDYVEHRTARRGRGARR